MAGGPLGEVEHAEHHLHRVRRRRGAAAYLLAVDAEHRLGGVPVDRVGVEVGDVDRNAGSVEVLPQRRVAERLDAHADLGRRRYGGQRAAEHLHDAELAALLLGRVVLEAAEPHRRHRPRRDRHRAADLDVPATTAASPRTAAAPRAPSARRGTAAGRGCCPPGRSTRRTGSPTRAAVVGGRRRTRDPGAVGMVSVSRELLHCVRRGAGRRRAPDRAGTTSARSTGRGRNRRTRPRIQSPSDGNPARFDIGTPIAVGFPSVAREHIPSACPDPQPSGPGPDVCRVSEAGHEKRVVAGDRRLGRERPDRRRTRSAGHRTRPRGAPAPHDRVLSSSRCVGRLSAVPSGSRRGSSSAPVGEYLASHEHQP